MHLKVRNLALGFSGLFQKWTGGGANWEWSFFLVFNGLIIVQDGVDSIPAGWVFSPRLDSPPVFSALKSFFSYY